MRLRLPHEPRRPLPKRPFRDSALVYGVMAVVIVVVAAATGGSLARALTFAAAFFVIAVVWSWRRWRARLAAGRRRQ